MLTLMFRNLSKTLRPNAGLSTQRYPEDPKLIEAELLELRNKESDFEEGALRWLEECMPPRTRTDNVSNNEPIDPVHKQKPSHMRGC